MSYSSYSSPSTSPSRFLSKDLFDVCRPIKEQLEFIQAKYGEDAIYNLTHPVLAALEELEKYKMLYDEEQQKTEELKSNIEKLEKDLEYKREEKLRLQQDIVMIEENSQEELSKAYDIIKTLKSDNKTLRQRIKNVDLAQEALQEGETSTASEEEAQVVVELRKKYFKEHEQVRDLEEQLSTEISHVDELKRNIEKLLNQNKELLRKNKSLVKQGKILIKEKGELSRNIDELSSEFIITKNALTELKLTNHDSDINSVNNKVDLPKYTEKELHDIFESKIKLIEKITDLEMEIERLKSSSPTESEKNEDNNLSNDECLVYGPINKEPDEKLYPWKSTKRDSGVRKFFSTFFKINSPRRTSNVNL